MSYRRLTLEGLPDKIQLMIFKYLSLYDWYYSFFLLNRRYNHLIKYITPVNINTKWLDHDIDRFGILISAYWVWNSRFLYFLIPRLQAIQSNIIQWLFLAPDSLEQTIKQLDKRVVHIIKKYKVQSNAPDFLVSKPNYYFCSISDDLPYLEEWIRENYPTQYEVIRNSGPRYHLPKRINHHDGKYLEIKQALAEVQRLERLKRKNMIYECAQQIWAELRGLSDVNLLDLVVEDKAYDFFPLTINRCQPIPSNFTLCYGLGYTQMYLPNLLNHESITEILYELPLWESLLNLECHSNARLLLCSILAPVCLQQTPERSTLVSFDNNQDSMISMTYENKKFLYPCRTLCESVKQNCEPRMINQFGYKWPNMIACEQYPGETDLCVSHSSSSTTTSTLPSTTTTTTTTTIKNLNLCSMCQSRASVSDLLNDYCRSSIVVRTRPIKVSSISENNFIFANKYKVRYFKRLDNKQIKFDFSIKNCSCIKLHSPTILFLSSNGEIIRFISIKRNPRVFKRFRNTIVLRKPRCQRRL
ncbi:unnamed protein product [Rotaria sp. Silwood2]|nr:unnamed protein product [Rotaria sp. Silwood2]CAF4262297.1 unnamed protein product [Rotaria sp. Silwood2]